MALIQSGGGTGPMKPGNLQMQGANSSGIIPRDKRKTKLPLTRKFFLSKKTAGKSQENGGKINEN